jgi:hypothetical protein
MLLFRNLATILKPAPVLLVVLLWMLRRNLLPIMYRYRLSIGL